MAIPVKVIAIEVTGLVLDVSALVECQSENEDIIKVGLWENRAPKLLQVILGSGLHPPCCGPAIAPPLCYPEQHPPQLSPTCVDTPCRLTFPLLVQRTTSFRSDEFLAE